VLAFTDLNAAMAAARDWCQARDLWINTNWSPETSLWRLELFSPSFRNGTTFEYPDLCQALMAACVEASRKLEAAA
jgi:hypothetical protein